MGYNTSPALLQKNLNLLTSIKDSIESNGEVRLDASGNIDSVYYQVRRLLAGCDRHPTFQGGMFVGLGSLKIKVDAASQSLILRAPSHSGVTVAAAVARTSEADIVAAAPSFTGSINTIEFFPSPSFNLQILTLRLAEAGWALIEESHQALDDGRSLFVIEKIESSGGFDILST